MDLGTSLTRADLQALHTGWGGVGWTVAHDTMQAVGGAAAGWITAVCGGKAKLAMLISIPLVIANGFTSNHPILRTFTSLGPGLLAGANALSTYNWITNGKRRSGGLRAA